MESILPYIRLCRQWCFSLFMIDQLLMSSLVLLGRVKWAVCDMQNLARPGLSTTQLDEPWAVPGTTRANGSCLGCRSSPSGRLTRCGMMGGTSH
jgi:hypothetical protein